MKMNFENPRLWEIEHAERLKAPGLVHWFILQTIPWIQVLFPILHKDEQEKS